MRSTSHLLPRETGARGRDGSGRRSRPRPGGRRGARRPAARRARRDVEARRRRRPGRGTSGGRRARRRAPGSVSGVLGEDAEAEVLEHRHDVGEDERLAEVELERGVGARRVRDRVRRRRCGSSAPATSASRWPTSATAAGGSVAGLVLVGKDAARSARRALAPRSRRAAATGARGGGRPSRASARRSRAAARRGGRRARAARGAARKKCRRACSPSPSARWSSTTSPVEACGERVADAAADRLGEGVARQDHHHGDAALERVRSERSRDVGRCSAAAMIVRMSARSASTGIVKSSAFGRLSKIATISLCSCESADDPLGLQDLLQTAAEDRDLGRLVGVGLRA